LTPPRFFRQFYNAFKADLPTVANAPVATRTNLIRIYENLIAADLAEFLDRIAAAGIAYKRILGNLNDDDTRTGLDDALRALSRAQGAPSHILLMFLMIRRDELGLGDTQLESIARLLASFFVRRNLTGTPQTYGLQTLFMDLIEQVNSRRGDKVEDAVREGLRRVSATDDQFLEKLSGQIYDENSDVARFVLVSLAEQGFTKETWTDLWERDGTHYKWTIEHILPQGTNLPEEWVEMLGGDRETAGDIQQRAVHRLGNLTITGFNSNLGNRSFAYKKNRADQRGNPIGFRNGLSLNTDVAAADKWTEQEIENRTAVLSQRTLELFPI